jgi:hypothetical protein
MVLDPSTDARSFMSISLVLDPVLGELESKNIDPFSFVRQSRCCIGSYKQIQGLASQTLGSRKITDLL